MSGSAFNYNVASGAFLPNQGMSFEGASSRRIYDWKSFRERAGAAQPVAPVATIPSAPAQANPASAAAPAAGTVSPAPSLGEVKDAALNKSTNLLRPNTIPGGALPPGSIDQNQFKAMLASASLGMTASPAAGSAVAPAPGMTGLASPIASGRQPVSPMPPITGRSPLAPAGILAAQQAEMVPSAGPAGATGTPGAAPDGIPTLTAAQFAALTGAPMPAAPMTGPAAAGAVNQADTNRAAAMPPAAIPPVVIPADALTMSDASIPPDGPAKPVDGGKDDDGVLKLTRIPDRETRQEYAAKGIKWKLVDDPAADKLFFGEDGKFGWDDFVDLINPLQHIPGVNAIYRELTGDEIHGAAELLGAIPFGPFSTLGAVVNIAVKSTTGKDIGGNVLAMIMGEDSKTSAADLAARGGPKPADTAAAASDHPAMEQAAASRMNWHNGRGRDNEADA